MESVLSAASGHLTEGAMRAFRQFHSGIRGEVRFPSGIEKTFVLEFWGNGNSTVAPYCVDENGPKWQHNTVIVFTDGWDRSKWFGDKVDGVHIATLTGSSRVNALFDFVVREWALNPKRRTYMQWQWWPSMSPGWQRKHINYDLICDSFSEAVIWKLSELSVLISPMPILRRNYGVVLNDDPGTVVSRRDPRVAGFFQRVIEKGQLAFFGADWDFKATEVVLYDQAKDEYRLFSDVHCKVKYSNMPMPPTFYATCSRDTGANCLLFCMAGRGASCSSRRCVCPTGTCVFDGFPKYCHGPEMPAAQLFAGDPRKANITTGAVGALAGYTSLWHSKSVALGAAALSGGLGLLACFGYRYSHKRLSEMKQPELFG
eukprot:UN0004